MKIFFLASIKSLKKGVGSGVRSGSRIRTKTSRIPNTEHNICMFQYIVQWYIQLHNVADPRWNTDSFEVVDPDTDFTSGFREDKMSQPQKKRKNFSVKSNMFPLESLGLS